MKRHQLVIRECDAVYGRVESVSTAVVVVNMPGYGSAVLTPAEFAAQFTLAMGNRPRV